MIGESMPLKYLLAAAAVAFLTLTGCASTGPGSDNTTYSQQQERNPNYGTGVAGY
jgi:outer membrane lipoprotein SlyB